jgi:hypothetical protein
MRMVPEDHREWRTSSYSGGAGGSSCVEVRWRKSSYSGTGNDSCVEVAFAEAVRVRDSKNVGGPVLGFSETAWRAFAAGL